MDATLDGSPSGSGPSARSAVTSRTPETPAARISARGPRFTSDSFRAVSQRSATPPPLISVLVASATPALGAGLALWLSDIPGWQVTRVVSTQEDLREALLAGADLVVASACLAGQLVTGDVRELLPSALLLVLADSFDPAVEVDFLRAGATGVVNVRSSCDELTRAAAELLAGRSIATTSAVRLLAEPERPKSTLTPRQVQILELLGQGLSTEEIARRMVITASTVKTHIGRLALRFNLDGRVALTARAAELLAEHRGP